MIVYVTMIGLPLVATLLMFRGLPPEASGGLGIALTLLFFFLHESFSAGSMHRKKSTFHRDAIIALLSGASGQLVILGSVYLAGFLNQEKITWKLGYQVPVVIVLSDLLGYGAHWLVHRIPALWSIHILHHTPKRLYWLNGLRSHPFDSILTNLIVSTWAILLGFSFEAMILAGLFITCHLLLQHSTVKLPSWMDRVFATPEWHIHHHDLQADGKPINLGRIFSFWDRLFGTASQSKGRPVGLGVAGLEDMSLVRELGFGPRGR